MDVAERRGDRELAVLDLRERFVDLPDLLGLRVELARVDVTVVDAVFLACADRYRPNGPKIGKETTRDLV